MRHVFILALLGAAAYGATPITGLKLGTDANGNGQSITNLNGITATGTVCSATITGAVHASTLTIAGKALGTAAALDAGSDFNEVPVWLEYNPEYATGTTAVFVVQAGGDSQQALERRDFAGMVAGGWLGSAATNDAPAGPITICTDSSDYYVRLGNGTIIMQTNSFSDALTYAASLSNTAGFRRRIHLSSYGFGDDATPATGIFYVDHPIMITNTVVITGDPNPTTQISPIANYPSTNLITVTGVGGSANIVCLEHLRFQQQGTQTGAINGVEFIDCSEPNLRWCEFTSFTGVGVKYTRTDNQMHHWAQVESCWFVLLNNAFGIQVSYPITNKTTSGSGQRELHIYDSKFYGYYTGAVGIAVGTNAGVVEVDNCAFVAHANYSPANFTAVRATGGQGVRVANSYFTDFATTNSAIEIVPATAMTQGVYIVGNHAPATRNTATGGVFVTVGENASNVVIGANSVDGFGALTDASADQLFAEDAGKINAEALYAGAITGAVHASTLTIAGKALGTAAAADTGGDTGDVPTWFEPPTNATGLVYYTDDVPGGLAVADQTIGSFATPTSVWPLAQITNAGTAAALDTGGGSGEIPVWMAIATNWDSGWVYKINSGDAAAVRTMSMADAVGQGYVGSAATNATGDFVATTNGTASNLTVVGAITAGTAVVRGEDTDARYHNWQSLGYPLYTTLTPGLIPEGATYWAIHSATAIHNKRSVYADHFGATSNVAYIGIAEHGAGTNYAVKLTVYCAERFFTGATRGVTTVLTTNLVALKGATNNIALGWAVPASASTNGVRDLTLLFANTDLADHATTTNSVYIIDVQSK